MKLYNVIRSARVYYLLFVDNHGEVVKVRS